MEMDKPKAVELVNGGKGMKTIQDKDESEHKASPEETANYLSLMFFWWVNDILKHFGKKGFNLFATPLYDPLPEDESRYLHNTIISFWESESKKDSPNLFKCILTGIGQPLVVCIPAALIYTACSLSLPVLVSQLAASLTSSSDTLVGAYAFGAAVVLVSVCLALANSLTFHPFFRFGMRARAALGSLIYQRVLTLHLYETSRIGSGHIINLFSTDLEVIMQAAKFSAFLLTGPLITCVGSALLVYEAGVSALAGIGYVFVILCQAVWMSKLSASLRTSIALATDRRIQVIDEVLHAMRVIKQYAWEPAFGNIIRKLRRSELLQIAKISLVSGVTFIGLACYGPVTTLLIVSTYALSGYNITVAFAIKIFGWAMVINYQTTMLVYNFQKLATAWRSLNRFKEFLCYTLDVQKLPRKYLERNACVEMRDVNSHWPSTDGHDEITRSASSFSLHMRYFTSLPSLTMVVGQVGSGKSSFLMTVLGEMRILSGHVLVNGSTAYSSQEPWVFSDTIQNNILFGNKMYKQRYRRVLKACCLEKDLNTYPSGDQTVIGQRGITLSGGQKARINLARAVYQERDIYLLDDPLSAVDSETGNHIMDQCITRMLKNKLVILATHQTQYLSLVDRVICLKQGEEVAIGDYENVKHLCSDLQMDSSRYDKVKEASAYVDVRENTKQKEELSADYEIADGGLMKTFWKYLKTGSLVNISVILATALLAEAVTIISGIWLTKWAKEIENITSHTAGSNNTFVKDSQEIEVTWLSSQYHAKIYTSLIIGMILARILTQVGFVVQSATASYGFHRMIWKSLIGAPMSFFEYNSLGDILNRFSRDMGFIDDQIGHLLRTIIPQAISTLGMITFTIWVNPWVLIGVLPYVVCMAAIRWYAVRGAVQFKILEAKCKGPVFSHISTTLDGLITIRAFGREDIFIERFHYLQNQHTSAWNNYICINRWMALYISLVTSGFLAVMIAAALSVKGSGIDSGLFGFVLISSISCFEELASTMTVIGEAEMMFTSVDRIVQFSNIPQEAAAITDIKPPSDWPSKGTLVMNKVTLQYSHQQEPALKNISLQINAGEKVGIIGRTGAGKTSLFNAILRLEEPLGSIEIDDIDVKEIGLRDLRTKITSIPQDPVLITGTLRRNLDPLLKKDDDALWEVLERVELKQYVKDLEGQLDAQVGVSGSTLSVGQKQLMCLARALLRENTILLFDEATANVDKSTDSLIQTSIKNHFSQYTVLTIAHRINTVMGSDRILVIEDGCIKEFDRPAILLQNEDSALYYYSKQNHASI